MKIDILFLGGTSIDFIREKKNKYTLSVGGGITNSALIASKLGVKAGLLSKVGKDSLGDFAIKTLKEEGVITKGIIQDKNIKTPIAVADIDKKGNAVYTFYKNTPRESIVPLNKAPKDLLNTCKFFHFGSTFSHRKETYQESLKYIKYLKKRRVFISFDPNLRPYSIKDKKDTRERVRNILKLVDLARISELDLEFITGTKNPEKGIKTLKKRYSCEVILTLGRRGSIVLRETSPLRRGRSNLRKIPAVKVKVKDTIGAGDAFNAAILYKIYETGKTNFFNNITPHLKFASKISGRVCTNYGARLKL